MVFIAERTMRTLPCLPGLHFFKITLLVGLDCFMVYLVLKLVAFFEQIFLKFDLFLELFKLLLHIQIFWVAMCDNVYSC